MDNNGHSLRDKLLIAVLSGAMALIGSAVGIYSKVETQDYRLAKVEATIDLIQKDIKLLLLRSK